MAHLDMSPLDIWCWFTKPLVTADDTPNYRLQINHSTFVVNVIHFLCIAAALMDANGCLFHIFYIGKLGCQGFVVKMRYSKSSPDPLVVVRCVIMVLAILIRSASSGSTTIARTTL